VVEQLIEATCLEKAQSSGVYVNPASVAGYNFWTQYQYNAGVAQAVSDCWYWQLGYWIIEDVFDTIRSSNAGARNVLDAPVKRLMQVGFTRSAVTLGQGGGYGGGYGYGYPTAGGQDSTTSEPKPRYVLSAYDGLSVPPCTARVTQGNLHIVHFDVTVAVRAGAVPDFMRQLCSAKEHAYAGPDGRQPAKAFKHNQITILETTQRAVDRSSSSTSAMGGYGYGAAYGMPTAGAGGGASPYGTPGAAGGLGGMMGLDSGSHQMYRYGQDAVVELDLVCEYIFEKAGYETLIPEAIKKTLDSAAGAAPNP
jgi:hypothetical protein